MKIYKGIKPNEWSTILKRPLIETKNLEIAVRSIMDQVQDQGDQALYKLTEKFDKVKLKNLMISSKEIESSVSQVNSKLKTAIKIAHGNIERFHTAQKEHAQIIETMPGVQCWRKNVAIQKVGLYIPGGTAPLFSTVLMLGIPAKIAGCEEIILCTPPQKNGQVDPAIMYTANLIGISKIYKVGGAQAIAAMTFGTESIPAVNKIFGPGNQFVMEAKQQALREGLAIDLPAGPSELLVLADGSANPKFVAADLLSQAEHGTDSQVVLIAFDDIFIDKVLLEIIEQLQSLPRKMIATEALGNSIAIIVKGKKEAIDIINEYAPEHLILAVENAELLANRIINAGSVFLGNYTPESAGDYASGTNHTLPTNGYAKSFSGVSLDSFYKKITFQKITEKGIQNLGSTVEIMAEAEQLIAHKNAIRIRLDTILEKQSGVEEVDSVELVGNSGFSLPALVRSSLRNFQAYTAARDEYDGQAEIYLDANENPFDSAVNRYPDPLQIILKKEIAKFKGVQVSNIFLGNGSDEAIDLLIRLFCEPNMDSVLMLPPSYGVYGVCAQIAGVTIRTIPLDNDFQPRLNDLKMLSARNAKILFICNPNNPTGSVIELSHIENIIRDFPGIVVLDEAYIDFSNVKSGIGLINKYPNLVVLQTFSKAWGMAGLRLGMAFSNPELIAWLNKIKLPYNINQMTQQLVLKKIKKPEMVEKQIQLIKIERERLSKSLIDFDFVKKIFPSQTNFILLKVNQAQQLYYFLLKKGIIIRDRSKQLNCEDCLRITIGLEVENDRLLSVMKDYSKIYASTLQLKTI